MRIAICETDVSYLNYIIRLLKQIREIELSTIVSYVDADWILSDLNTRSEAFDIAVINKDFGKQQGVAIARNIAEKNSCCQIIIVSEVNAVFPEYYQVNSAYLLPKDLVPNHLVTVIQKAYSNLEKLDNTFLLVISNHEKIFIPAGEILYLERELRKTLIVLKNEVIETFQTPQQLMSKYLMCQFRQCHRSIYVNIHQVRRLRANEITLNGGISIPVGRAFLSQVKSMFQ